MTDIGKIDRDFFDEHIYPYLGAEREDELLGPKHGVDFGVIDVGDHVVALATDPLSLLPELGFEKAGWFAFHVVMSDVAVSGLHPSHLAVEFNLPPEIADEEFAEVWKTFDREAKKLGVSIVTGHTARYSGCQYPWVGGATTLAIGEKQDLVRPDGARPGDSVLVTKGPGVETAGFLVTLFEDRIDLPEDDIADAKDRFYDMSPVEDALVAAEAGGVTAMHDATECGIHGALVEMARSAGVRFDVSHDDVPILPGVLEACDYFDIDPWASTTEGTLVLTVEAEAAETVLAAFDDADIPAAEMGKVSEGDGVYVDGDRIEHPDVDPSLQVFAELSADRE
ncbi:AIR synthase family protein [Haladaptatus sp. AB618]|uniref:AIR synthase family protein n=1 Tax=Haladaptatus sp. AB618 TaxID=2934173 RepID=UPI00209BE5A5|nr:AIR synthase family protein [Haladaptatus sp. AB618]MCO8253985.1 AIR synthase family protein [Haladaptatus sp. AB618]